MDQTHDPSRNASMTSEPTYRVVVLELTNVVSRIRTDRPNIYVGVTTRTAEQLADGLNEANTNLHGYATTSGSLTNSPPQAHSPTQKQNNFETT